MGKIYKIELVPEDNNYSFKYYIINSGNCSKCLGGFGNDVFAIADAPLVTSKHFYIKEIQRRQCYITNYNMDGQSVAKEDTVLNGIENRYVIK
ncbi:MAG: hypothetical protein SFY32_07290 [Bacteroidota bacterium]|nr:hypothetical protein [Bacteroidota bacterium]